MEFSFQEYQRIHIVTKNTCSRRDISIRIEESTPSRIIVPALEIVISAFHIIEISAVSKRVIGIRKGTLQRCHTARDRCGECSPSIIRVGADLRAACILDLGDVAVGVVVERMLVLLRHAFGKGQIPTITATVFDMRNHWYHPFLCTWISCAFVVPRHRNGGRDRKRTFIR